MSDFKQEIAQTVGENVLPSCQTRLHSERLFPFAVIGFMSPNNSSHDSQSEGWDRFVNVAIWRNINSVGQDTRIVTEAGECVVSMATDQCASIKFS